MKKTSEEVAPAGTVVATAKNIDVADGAFVAKMAKFVKASMKGWDYAKKNVDEATKIVLAADTTGAHTEKHQKRMMGEIAKLLAAGRASKHCAEKPWEARRAAWLALAPDGSPAGLRLVARDRDDLLFAVEPRP